MKRVVLDWAWFERSSRAMARRCQARLSDLSTNWDTSREGRGEPIGDREAPARSNRPSRPSRPGGARPGARLSDGIVVLGRGGMTLGSRLSHLLRLPVVGAVLISRFQDPTQRKPDAPPVDGVVLSPAALASGGPLLLVDNIISEGVTLGLSRQALVEAGVARERLLPCALLARGHQAPEGIIGARVPDEVWYVFPWEIDAAEGTIID